MALFISGVCMDRYGRIKKIVLLSTAFVITLLPQAEGDMRPVVLRLEGSATATIVSEKTTVALNKGDLIKPGNRIQTKINSRMVVDYGGDRHIRLDERTILEVGIYSPDHKNDEKTDEKNKRNDTTIHAVAGEIWISIPKRVSPDRRLSILTTHTELNPDKAIFRLSIFQTNSLLVKVYQGSVTVKSKKNTARKGVASRKSKPWIHILKPMQQIYIRPDGTSTRPFQFMVKPDRNTWVLWNQSLDKKYLLNQQ